MPGRRRFRRSRRGTAIAPGPGSAVVAGPDGGARGFGRPALGRTVPLAAAGPAPERPVRAGAQVLRADGRQGVR